MFSVQEPAPLKVVFPCFLSAAFISFSEAKEPNSTSLTTMRPPATAARGASVRAPNTVVARSPARNN